MKEDVVDFIEDVEEKIKDIKDGLANGKKVGYDILKLHQIVVNFEKDSDKSWWREQLQP